MVRDKESLTRLTNCCACHKFFTLMGDWCHRQCHRHHQQDDDAWRTRNLAPAHGGSYSLKFLKPARGRLKYLSLSPLYPTQVFLPIVSFLGGNAIIPPLLDSFVSANNDTTSKKPVQSHKSKSSQVFFFLKDSSQVFVPLFFVSVHACWAVASKLSRTEQVIEVLST